MTNLEKANKAVLKLVEDDVWYFADIKPLIVFWEPQLAYSYYNAKNDETFLYYVEWKRKFFIEICINKEYVSSGSWSRFELSSWYDDVVDSYLSKYSPYLSPNESLKLFIENDLPKLADHQRDKRVCVTCWTDYWQWNVWHFKLDHEFLELLAKSWLLINYAVEVQK